MKPKDTEISYEAWRYFDNEIEKQYKHEKGYANQGIDWFYSVEDRAELERRMKWGRLQKQAEVSFNLGREDGLKSFYKYLLDNKLLCEHCGTIVLETCVIRNLAAGRVQGEQV